MNICIFKLSKDQGTTMWCDKVSIVDDHLYGTLNDNFVFESTSVECISLSGRGIYLRTRSGSKYVVSTPGESALKKLFKQLVAEIN